MEHATRPAWTGGIDVEELSRPGGALIGALMNCMALRNQTTTEMAAELGVTYGYICHLRNGSRNLATCAESFTRACAAYLGVPHITVLLMAGKVKEEDFYGVDALSQRQIDLAVSAIGADAKYGPLLNAEICGGSLETKYAFIRLYEDATGKQLLGPRVDVHEMLASLKALQAQVQADAAARQEAQAESEAEDNRKKHLRVVE